MTTEFVDLGLALFVDDQIKNARRWSVVDVDGVSYITLVEVALDDEGSLLPPSWGAMAAYYPWSPASIRAAALICEARFAARFGDTK